MVVWRYALLFIALSATSKASRKPVLRFRFYFSPWYVVFSPFTFLIKSQILFQLAAKLKLNAPYAHTWLEIVGVRWGKVAHLVFMFFG